MWVLLMSTFDNNSRYPMCMKYLVSLQSKKTQRKYDSLLWIWQSCMVVCIGEKNLSPQIVSLWHDDLFRLIIFKAPKVGRTFDHNCLKGYSESTCSRQEAITVDNYGIKMWTSCVDREEPRQAYLLKFLCDPLSLHGPANICWPNICISIFMWIAFFSCEVPNYPNILFCL